MMSINQDFIEEYQEEEEQAFKRYKNILDRIGSLKGPVFNLIPGNPWSQFAFSGTTIFILKPCSETIFEQSYNISPNEIPDLIKFTKETKKIQFVLNKPPKDFQKYDYLEPLLRELRPPVVSGLYTPPSDDYIKIYKRCSLEVDTLISMSPYLKRVNYENKSAIDNLISIYTSARYRGFDEIAELFINNLLLYPNYAANYLTLADKFLLESSRNPLNVNFSCTFDEISKMKLLGFQNRQSPNKKSFPEIGSFLMKKCTHYPNSLTACNFLIHEYEDNDLYKVFFALNDAVIDRNDPVIIQKRDELEEILSDIWEDTRIKSTMEPYHYSINIACGVVGHILTPGTGFLASVVPEIINSTNSHYIDQVSELIAKNVSRPYLATIFDFKKKYSV